MVAMAQGSDDMSEESKEIPGLWELNVHRALERKTFPLYFLFFLFHKQLWS